MHARVDVYSGPCHAVVARHYPPCVGAECSGPPLPATYPHTLRHSHTASTPTRCAWRLKHTSDRPTKHSCLPPAHRVPGCFLREPRCALLWGTIAGPPSTLASVFPATVSVGAAVRPVVCLREQRCRGCCERQGLVDGRYPTTIRVPNRKTNGAIDALAGTAHHHQHCACIASWMTAFAQPVTRLSAFLHFLTSYLGEVHSKISSIVSNYLFRVFNMTFSILRILNSRSCCADFPF